VIGILLAQVVNWLIAKPVPANATSLQILQSWNGQVGWRWMFGVTAIPSLLFFVAMFVVPESPRWLAKNGAHERAKHVLSRIGGESYGVQALREIEATVTQDTKRMDLRMLLDRRMLRVLLLGIGLAVLQQWCGINVIFNYAEEVFSAAGYTVSDILFNIVVTGAVNLLFTLLLLDLWIATAGAFDAHWFRWSCDDLYLPGCFLLRPQPRRPHAGARGRGYRVLCHVSCSRDLGHHFRIFPNRIRGAAMSVAVTSLWIASFILTYTFPLFNHALGAAKTFWIYAAICVAGFFFIKARLPETKGKPSNKSKISGSNRDS